MLYELNVYCNFSAKYFNTIDDSDDDGDDDDENNRNTMCYNSIINTTLFLYLRIREQLLPRA